MMRSSPAILVILLLLPAGILHADGDAHFRLTILIEMDWDEGDMYRTYFGTADLNLELSDGSDSAYVEYVERFMREFPGEPVPDFLGNVSGSGELAVEGSGSSGEVSMTYEGTASVDVTGEAIIHPGLGQVLDVTLSGTTDEVWTVHTPDGDMVMSQTGPISPVSLVFDYTGDEVEVSEPWDEGTTREVYSLVLMNDPFTGSD